MTVRVALVEDNARFRRTLERVISRAEGFELAGSFDSVEALDLALVRPQAMAGRWDVVVMDLDLPGASGLVGIARVKRAHPGLAVVVCTVFEEPLTIVQAISAGADGYLLKGASMDELLEQLRVVAEGGSSMSSGVARTLFDVVRTLAPADADEPAPDRLQLTEREREVLRCLVDGMSYKQVADALGLSYHTVRTHIRNIYRKLQVQNVAEAVSKAVRMRLV